MLSFIGVYFVAYIIGQYWPIINKQTAQIFKLICVHFAPAGLAFIG